ncbi:uncharacterized protein LOC115376351 [Myripristis murdjan]|uniref:uncharacterized protein LOC115376351 n=1 Tax=Myripristis murdjan TaxID=586833 RepID=UPI001175CF1A|nr:uncharacterized protein LOC115376351 [Myripristis murdjan]
MDHFYKYPVYFECPSLDGEQKKRIENYFQIRRRSGGGECGPLRTVTDKVYTIAFRNKTDQQRVLQKSEHVLELATGLLALTIHDDPGLQSSSHTTTSTSSRSVHPDLRSTTPGQQSHLPIHSSTLTPCGVEHELQLDTYLIRYLKEHPRAGKKLDEELASMASSVQLHPDEGRVLVKGVIPDMDEVQQWKAKIEKVFEQINERYVCHFELDPHKVSILLRSRSSSQDTDEVRVYSQVGVAVVVGEHSQVQARLRDVMGSHITGQGSGVSQKQTTTRRLGEAKLRLLWEDIEHSLRQDIPGVKITQGDAGQLVLEGSVEEIVKAGDIVSKKENLVLERMVSHVGPHLLAFLRNEYGGPGMLVKFLGVGSNVEIELRDTELHLFTLCSDKLDETEKALLDKFKEEKIDVPDRSAVPSELKEKLESKAKEMNQGRCKVWVRFTSGGKICLLGHTKEVEELSEVIIQFILDQSSQNSLVQKTVTIDLPRNTTVATYYLDSGLQVVVCQGDITKEHADALVNAANEDLNHVGGVAAALSRAGGAQVQTESSTLVKQVGKIPTGDVVVTTGGNLNCYKLLHAVGPVQGRAGGRERELLEKAVCSVLNLAEMMEFQSIAIPCISSGTYGVPIRVCTEAIVTAVKRFGIQGRGLNKVILIDNRGEVVRAMQEACNRLLQGNNTGHSTNRDHSFQSGPSAATQDPVRGAMAGSAGDSVQVEIVQGLIEIQQSDALVSPMVGHNPLSTRIGHCLYNLVGPQLVTRFDNEAGAATPLDEIVPVEGLPGLPCGCVFFLNLLPWDDQQGTAIQALRQGIGKILAFCDSRGFSSVAVPALGTGAVLCFPHAVVARVLLEEIQAYEQNRTRRTPFMARIIIHPSDKETIKAFQSAQEVVHLKRFMDSAHSDQVDTTRIVLLGKTGAGKSSLANTIFEDTVFKTASSPQSQTSICKAESRSVNGRSITLIDTPGFFDTGKTEEQLKKEIVKCVIECAPGPHAFLIVLKVERYTDHEEGVVKKISQYFSEEAFRYATVVFTHGDDLHEGMKIHDFVNQSEGLKELVEKCGWRCCVVDNKCWKNQQDPYRSNQFQVAQLLCTIDKIMEEHNGGCYTNELLEAAEREIQKEQERIRQSSGNMSEKEIREKAKIEVCNRFWIKFAGVTTGVLLGAFLGLAVVAGAAIIAVKSLSSVQNLKAIASTVAARIAGGGAAAGGAAAAEAAAACGAAEAAAGGAAGAGGLGAAGMALGISAAVIGGAGAVVGGVTGYDAAEEAETVEEAIDKAAGAVWNKAEDAVCRVKKTFDRMTKQN